MLKYFTIFIQDPFNKPEKEISDKVITLERAIEMWEDVKKKHGYDQGYKTIPQLFTIFYFLNIRVKAHRHPHTLL